MSKEFRSLDPAYILEWILETLPARRDWLDPRIEQLARVAVEEAKHNEDHRLVEPPEKAAREHLKKMPS